MSSSSAAPAHPHLRSLIMNSIRCTYTYTHLLMFASACAYDAHALAHTRTNKNTCLLTHAHTADTHEKMHTHHAHTCSSSTACRAARRWQYQANRLLACSRCTCAASLQHVITIPSITASSLLRHRAPYPLRDCRKPRPSRVDQLSPGALLTLLAFRRFAERPVQQEESVLSLRRACSERQHHSTALPDGADAGVSRVDIRSIMFAAPRSSLRLCSADLGWLS